MDQQLLLDPKCPMALWVLGPRLHLRCHSVQQLLRDPMFRWVLSVLGHHLRQQFHLVPQFRKPLPFPMDRLRRLDLMFRLALWVLGPRWLRQSPRGQPRLRDPMFRWVLWVLGRHLHRLCRMDPRFLEYLVPPMCRLVRWLRSLPQFRMDRLFLMGQQLLLDPMFLMDPLGLGHHLRQQFHLAPLLLRDLMCRTALWVLGHRMLRRSRMDRLLRLDPMFRLVLWGLGRHSPRRFHSAPLLLRGLMFLTVLWVLGPRWLRLSPRGQPRLRDLMCHSALWLRLLRLCRRVRLSLTDRRFHLALLRRLDLMCHLALSVLGPHWLRLCRMDLLLRPVPMFPRDLLGLGHHLRQPFLKDRLRRLDLMFRRVLWVLGPRWLRLFPMVQPFRMDLLFPVRPMCHLALLDPVLRRHPLSPMGQPLQWGLMFHLGLLALGHHLGQQFHLDPLFLVRPKFRTALWVLGPRWLRRFLMGQQLLLGLMSRLVLWLRLLRLCRRVRLSLTDRRFHLALLRLRDRMFLMDRWLHLLRLFHWDQPFLKDRLLLRDPMFLTALWVLGRHLHLRSLMGQPPRWVLMCRWVLWVLGPRWLRLFLMDQQLLLDPKFRTALWLPKARGHHLHLQHRWLRRSRMDRLLLRDLMCHLDQ